MNNLEKQQHQIFLKKKLKKLKIFQGNHNLEVWFQNKMNYRELKK